MTILYEWFPPMAAITMPTGAGHPACRSSRGGAVCVETAGHDARLMIINARPTPYEGIPDAIPRTPHRGSPPAPVSFAVNNL